MSTVEPEILSLNPFEPGYFADPYAQYAGVRESSPVHQSLLGPWVLFGHDDVLRVLRDPGLSVEEHNVAANPLSEAMRAQLAEITDDVAMDRNRSMLDLDPPDHDRLRRLVAKAFNPAMIRALVPRIEALVGEALDGMAGRGDRADVITDLAFPLPFTVISEMLGMPDGDRDRLRDWSHAMVKTLDPIISPEEVRAAFDASTLMVEHIRAAIEWKRREPADDLLTKLTGAEDQGDVLTEDELVAQVALLYIAGHETTVNLIGNGTFALLRHPDQLDRLRSDPSLDEQAIEELLRFDSPVQFSRRITLAPTRRSATSPSIRVCSCSRASALRIAIPTSGAPRPTRSTSGAKAPPSTCRSGVGCTTAWARRWRGSRRGWRSRPSSDGSPSSRSPIPAPNRHGTAGSCSAASTVSPSPSLTTHDVCTVGPGFRDGRCRPCGRR